MITQDDIAECATAIVMGMNLKEGESVIIQGGSHTQELLEEIGVLCYKNGAQPLITATTDNYSARIYREIRKETLETTPKHILAAFRETDVYIIVEPLKDPDIQTKFPPEKIASKTKANVPIRKVLYGEETGPGKRWTYVGWPTPEAAKFYNVNYAELERLIIDGIKVPASTLKKSTSEIAKRLKGRNVLRITDHKGTDFTCKIKGRRINEDDGIVDEHDVEIGDLGNNLPAGEVFIASHETFGDGTLFCPITVDRFSKKIIRDATLVFKDGRLLLDECTAKVNGKKLVDTFTRCQDIDRKEDNSRTINIAELGVGCNPAIDRAIGYVLIDEKLAGSVHIAFGSNSGYGGTSKSCLHWDFVTHPNVTIEAIDSGEPIMKAGKII